MNWSDERYVRLYTRTTADLLAFGWEGRLVWYELLRAADRAGVIDTGGDLDALPELLRVPIAIFEVGWPRILKRESARVTEQAITLMNYIEANEAKQSDRMRQAESRTRRRDVALAAGADPSGAKAAARPDRYGSGSDVTPCDPSGSQAVTKGHDGSQRVTVGHSVPSLAVPSLDQDPVPEVDSVSPEQLRKPKAADPAPNPDAFLLADLLRTVVLTSKPNHRISDETSWRSTRRSWAKELAKTLRRRPRPALERAIKFLGEQTGGAYAFVVESAKGLDEKLDRIEVAMTRAAAPPIAARPSLSAVVVPKSEVLFDGYGEAKAREAAAKAAGGSR